MATEGSIAGREVFDEINIEYEHAYGDNPFKKALINKALTILEPGSRVLDVGCGTGVPVSQMLANAGMAVMGIDIAPNMIRIAEKRVKGKFIVQDMLEMKLDTTYAGIFIIYSHLMLRYASFHSTVYECAKALEPNGILCIGQSPADAYVTSDSQYDETKSYCEPENLPLAFMGKDHPTFAMTREGQLEMLRSMSLEIVYETKDVFYPKNHEYKAEHQQYIIARRRGDMAISPPMPSPIEK